MVNLVDALKERLRAERVRRVAEGKEFLAARIATVYGVEIEGWRTIGGAPPERGFADAFARATGYGW